MKDKCAQKKNKLNWLGNFRDFILKSISSGTIKGAQSKIWKLWNKRVSKLNSIPNYTKLPKMFQWFWMLYIWISENFILWNEISETVMLIFLRLKSSPILSSILTLSVLIIQSSETFSSLICPIFWYCFHRSVIKYLFRSIKVPCFIPFQPNNNAIYAQIF